MRGFWILTKYCTGAGAVLLLAIAGGQSASAMRQSPKDASSHNPSAETRLISKQAFDVYKNEGIVVIDNVLTTEELFLARREIFSALDCKKTSRNSMSEGGKLLFSMNSQEDLSVRSDLVVWVSEAIGQGQRCTVGPGLEQVLRHLRSVPKEFEDFGLDAKLLGVPFSSQLACYDGGKSHYIAHRDTPDLPSDSSYAEPDLKVEGTPSITLFIKVKQALSSFKTGLSRIMHGDMDARLMTIIIYLNDVSWDSEAGGLSDSGHLRIYVGAHKDDDTGETSSRIRDIEPLGGRMVIFDSKRILHEVRPSHQRRIALTSWVGGSHSRYVWMRPFCVPLQEINWAYYFELILK